MQLNGTLALETGTPPDKGPRFPALKRLLSDQPAGTGTIGRF